MSLEGEESESDTEWLLIESYWEDLIINIYKN